MRRFLKIIFALFIFHNSLYAQWKIVNEGFKFHGASAQSIDFINNKIGWAVSDGKIWRTSDGGINWNIINQDKQWEFRNIDFISEYSGWATGNDPISNKKIALKTENGGLEWTVKYTGFVSKLFVINDSVIYIHRGGGDFRKTTNNGKTWEDINLPVNFWNIKAIQFINEQIGIVAGSVSEKGFIAHTVNGGSDWYIRKFSEFDEIISIKYACESSLYFLCRIKDQTELNYTQDFGHTWENYYTSNKWLGSNLIINPLNNDIFYLVVNDTMNINRLLKSPDKGLTWYEIFSVNGPWEISNIKLDKNDTGLIICFLWGERGSLYSLILSNENSEKSWQIYNIYYPINDVFFLDKVRGFAVGGYDFLHGPAGGDVFLTSNGGKTWFLNKSLLGFMINKCFFVSDSTGFILTDSRDDLHFLKTTDSGKNWTPFTSDLNGISNINDITFSDEQTGWIAGRDISKNAAAILETTNGGENWVSILEFRDTAINSIFADNSTIWAVGEVGFIVKYDEQDGWQTIAGLTDLPLNKVFFSTETHSWIAGGYMNSPEFQSILLKTTDGGQTWDESKFDSYLINDMFFTDSLHGWSIGQDTSRFGMILETFDGGDNWNPVVENLSVPLTAIHFKDGYGWAVGGNGLILKTTDGTTWVNQKTGKAYPSEYKLFQNYPNPFNPTTKIEFSIPKSELVTLKIYNLLGQEVQTLVSKRMNAGAYKYDWDAATLANGIYIYRLEAGDFTETKKMVLIK